MACRRDGYDGSQEGGEYRARASRARHFAVDGEGHAAELQASDWRSAVKARCDFFGDLLRYVELGVRQGILAVPRAALFFFVRFDPRRAGSIPQIGSFLRRIYNAIIAQVSSEVNAAVIVWSWVRSPKVDPWIHIGCYTARLAQSVERTTLNARSLFLFFFVGLLFFLVYSTIGNFGAYWVS